MTRKKTSSVRPPSKFAIQTSSALTYVASSFWRSTDNASAGPWSPLEKFLAPLIISFVSDVPVHCYISLAILRILSVTLAPTWISSFLFLTDCKGGYQFVSLVNICVIYVDVLG